MTRRLARGLELGAVGLGAFLYFQGAMYATIEWTDEGQIVYPSWRVAEGVLPYVDFQHLYGPSVFFLNGALFRLVGPDLRAVRVSLALVRALIAVLVYVLSRRLAPRPIALLVTAVLVAAWGIPLWLFNTPYASFYGTALCLAAILVLSGGIGLARAFAAGLALGVAATFKQTQGVFAFLALALFLLYDTPAAGSRSGWAIRLAALAGTLALPLVYLARHLASPTVLLLLAPFALSVVALGLRELRAGSGHDGVRPLLAATAGMAIPAAGYAVLYWSAGALPELVYNTVAGLPQRIRWFTPFIVPGQPPLFLAGVMVTGFGTLAAVAAWLARRRAIHALAAVAALAGLVVTAAGFIERIGGRGRLPRFLMGGGFGDVTALLPWLPFGLLAAAVPSLLRGTSRDLALVFFAAAAALLQFYPAADLPHALMLLPAVLPLAAHGLARAWHATRGGPSALRAAAAFLVVLWPLMAIGPFVQFRRLAMPPAPSATFERAPGIWSAGTKVEDAAALVRELTGPAYAGRGLFVLADEQMLYFLAGVPSVLERDEFVLYLLGADLLAIPDARAMLDERRMVAQLQATQPVIVDATDTPAGMRFRAAFPAIAAFIDADYGSATVIGGYRVLAPRDMGARR